MIGKEFLAEFVRSIHMRAGGDNCGPNRDVKGNHVIDLAVIGLLAVCCVIGFMFFQRTLLTLVNGDYATVTDLVGITEGKQADKVSGDVSSLAEAARRVGEMRMRSMQTALMAETVESNPIGLLSDVFISPASIDIGAITPLPHEEREVELPPLVEVHGIVISGVATMAILDVPGDGNGIIVEPGSTFAGGSGKVISIDSGRVSYTWRGRYFSVALAE